MLNWVKGKVRGGGTRLFDARVKSAEEQARASEERARLADERAGRAIALVDSMRIRSEADRQTIERLTAAVAPKDDHPGRFAALLLATALSFGAFAFVISLVPPAFRTPPPNYAKAGVAGLFVMAAEGDGEAEADDTIELALAVRVDQNGPGVVYEATFPRRLVGHHFVLGLTQNAVLAGIKAEVNGLTVDNPPCLAQDGAWRRAATCQLISGRVPGSSDRGSVGCNRASGDEEDTVTIAISGSAAYVSSYDWAHHVTSFPYLGNVEGMGFGSAKNLVEGAFGATATVDSLTTCYSVNLNHDWQDHTPNVEPSTQAGDYMAWNPASNFAAYVIVSTERNAQAKGNLLLAGLGILGAASLTLAGTTFRSFARLRAQARSPGVDGRRAKGTRGPGAPGWRR